MFINQVDGSGKFFTSNVNTDNVSAVNVSATNLTTTTFSPTNVNASVLIANESDIDTQNSSTINTSLINASTSNVSTKNISLLNVSTIDANTIMSNTLILPSNGLYNDASIQTLGDQLKIKAGASNSIGFLTDTAVNMVYDGDLNISSNLNASTINTSELNGDIISSENQLNVRNSTGKKFTMRHDGDEINFYGALNNNSQPSNYLFYTDAGGVNSNVKLKINKNTDVVEVISLEATDILTGDIVCDDVNTSDLDALQVNTSVINASVSNVSTKNVSFLTANTISTTNTSSTNVSTQDVFIYDKNGGGTFSQIERSGGNDFTIKHTNNTDIKIYSDTGTGIPVIQIQGGSDIVEVPQLDAVELNGTTINTDGNLNASTINTSLINASSTHSSNISNFLLNSSLGYIDVVNSTSVNSSTINASDLNVSNFNPTTLNTSALNSSSLNSSNISCVNISSSSVVEANLHSSKTYELYNTNKTIGISDYYTTTGDGMDGLASDIIYPAFKKESGTYTDYNILNMMAFNNNSTKSNRFIDVPATMNCSLIEYDLMEGDTLNSSTVNCSTLNASSIDLPPVYNASTINSSTVNSSTINTNQLFVAPNTNADVDIGKATVGYVGWGNLAGFSHIDCATTTNYAVLQAGTGETFLNAKSGQKLNIRINNQDAVVISPNKNATFKQDVIIDGSLKVNNYIQPSTNAYLKWLQGSGQSWHFWRLGWGSGTTSRVYFQNLSGDNSCYVYATGFFNPSDDRIKDNEQPIINALDTINKIKPMNYQKYGNLEKTGESVKETGVIVQQIHYEVPELKHLITYGEEEDDTGIQDLPAEKQFDDLTDEDYEGLGWTAKTCSINYIQLIPFLIQSIKELNEKVKELENKL